MTDLQMITPKMAQEWLESSKSDERFKRRIRWWHVKELSRLMETGQFQPNVLIALVHLNGDTYIANGNHTLNAIVEAQKPIALPVQHYSFSQEHELADLYATFDKQNKRTRMDSLRAFGALQRFDMTENQINKTANAVSWILKDFGIKGKRSRISEAELMGRMIEWYPVATELIESISNLDVQMREITSRAPVYSVALATMRYQPDKAREFWHGVVGGDGLGMNDPRRRLREWLLVTGLRGGGGVRVQTVAPGYMSRVVAYLWGKWFNGSDILRMSLEHIKASDPIAIEGTPFTPVPTVRKRSVNGTPTREVLEAV